MKKIEEKKDLSIKALAIDIESEIFKGMLFDLNAEIRRCVSQVYDQNFEAGEISLKLSIELPTAFQTFPAKKADGEIYNELYSFRKPSFEHKITTVLKKQYKKDGMYTDQREVQFVDGKFIAVPVEKAQLSIDDLREDA